MRLVDALRLEPGANQEAAQAVALVGAGGKTSALFCLARELPGKTVFLTTTTHLALPQAARADYHFIASSSTEIDQALDRNPQGVLLFTGSEIEGGRLAGLQGETLERLRQVAQERNVLLLIEADGCRQRPLKAPAGHEPAIPPWVDVVIVCVGLSGLGRLLDSGSVHRPERFAAVSGLAEGSPVTPAALVRLLTHPEAGLKNIPPGARRTVLLNQADDPARQSQAAGMAGDLLRTYGQVVVTCLQPILPAHSGPALVVYERVAAIILAAGASTRLGAPKQLLDWRGQPLVLRAVQIAIQAGLQPVIVVTGAHGEAVRAAVGSPAGLPLQVIDNQDWAAGQSTSVIAGLRALPAETGAAVFLLCDQPLISPELVRSLVALHSETLSPVVAPMVDGTRGNPVLFDRRTFPDMLSLTGDTGGRALFSRYPVLWLPWHDRSVLADIDTLDDYHRLQDLEA